MNLPHPLDRPFQKEAYQRIANSKAKYVICNLKTGLGKTALAANLAVEGYKTLACVMTKSLQWQYVEPYGFTELFGKGNYICGCSLNGRGKPLQTPSDLFVLAASADVCDLEKGIHKRWCKESCDYYVARDSFIYRQAGIINYKKFLLDRPVVNSMPGTKTKGFDPDILVFDEAHELSDLVVEHSGLSYNWSYKKIMKYCEPLILNDMPHFLAIDAAKEWIQGLLSSLGNNPPKKGKDIKKWQREKRWHQHTIDKIETVSDALEIEPDCWYVQADREGITIRPKTAKYHFRPLFEKAGKIVMMSATIQPKDIEALGITDYEFVKMPNPIPAMMRPVYDLDAPPITAKSTYAECKQHAQIISNLFNSKPDHWNSVVHFPSKKKSEDWGEWLYQMTGRPVYVPERGLSTDEAYQRWVDFEADNTGAIASCWNMMTGVDGKNININITGCVPYPNFGDGFEKARFDHNPGEARVRVANLIEQQQGRNRRGFIEHYGPSAEKYNAIADGKWVRLKSAFDKDFLQAIMKN